MLKVKRIRKLVWLISKEISRITRKDYKKEREKFYNDKRFNSSGTHNSSK